MTKEVAICNNCGFTGHPDLFDACMSAYHDLRCPMCKTTNINTSYLVKAWAERGEKYG